MFGKTLLLKYELGDLNPWSNFGLDSHTWIWSIPQNPSASGTYSFGKAKNR